MDIFDELKLKLKNTGLSENEIGVYLALLKLGESKTGKILEEYKMSSGKIYIVLDKLVKKGLVSHIIRDNIKHFTAQPPNNILQYLEKEKHKVESKENEIKLLIPELLKIINSPKASISIEIYEGIEGFKSAVSRYLSEVGNNFIEYSFDNLEFGNDGELHDSLKYAGIEYVKILKERKIKDKWLISTTNPKSINIMKKIYEGSGSEFRYVKNQRFASILAVKDITLIFGYNDIRVVYIKSEYIAESFIKMHKSMWSLGKKI